MPAQNKAQSKSGISPVAVGVAGAVGAGVGVAAALAFRDEKTRRKAREVINNVKDQATAYADEITKQARESAPMKEMEKIVGEQLHSKAVSKTASKVKSAKNAAKKA